MERLADIADVLVGATAGKDDGAQIYLRPGAITDTGIDQDWESSAPAPIKGRESRLREDDVLVRAKGRDLAVGRVGTEHAGAFTTPDVFVVRVNTAVCDPGYLVAALRSPTIRAQLAGGLQGSTMPRLTREALANLELPLPPMSTQAQISVLAKASEVELSLMDQLRTLRTQLHTELLRAALEKAHAEDGHPPRGLNPGPADASAKGSPIQPRKQKGGSNMIT